MTSSYLSKDFFSARHLVSNWECSHSMSRAAERILNPAAGRPQSPRSQDADPKLNIAVIFTAVESTLAALKHAGVLASHLGACISLVVPQVVPYPLPLNNSPISPGFSQRRFRVIAGQSRVETSPVYFCRDRMETLKAVLRPHSLLVIGGRKRWWPTTESRLAANCARPAMK